MLNGTIMAGAPTPRSALRQGVPPAHWHWATRQSRGQGTLTVTEWHGTPDPHPHRHPRFAGDRGWRSHPRFAGPGDRGSIPTAIPDLPESSGIQLSTIEYCKGVEFRLPQCLTLRLIVMPKLINLRRSAMSDDAADYSGTSDSDSESDKVWP